MVVDSRTGQTGPVPVMAGIAVGADVLGRLLAPSLLKVWPLLVVSLSPSDPHLLLARVDPRALLVVVVVTVRIARALAVYRSVGRATAQFRSARFRRLLVPSGGSRWADRS